MSKCSVRTLRKICDLLQEARLGTRDKLMQEKLSNLRDDAFAAMRLQIELSTIDIQCVRQS